MRKTVSNNLEKTLKSGRVSNRDSLDSDGDEGREIRDVRRYIDISCARNSNMNEALTPVDVALNTLDTLPKTFRILARIMLPIKTKPINLDQEAISISIFNSNANLPSSDVIKSVPGGGLSSDKMGSPLPSTGVEVGL